jgi:hypothetical protein
MTRGSALLTPLFDPSAFELANWSFASFLGLDDWLGFPFGMTGLLCDTTQLMAAGEVPRGRL